MSIFKNMFDREKKIVKSNTDFWTWFQKNQKSFFNAIKKHKNIEESFLNKLSAKLNELGDGFFFLAGMHDDKTAELIITADGDIRNIAIVEELIQAAPVIENWKLTALKPASDIENVSIEMAGYKFNEENLRFYSEINTYFPDEIDITVTYSDFKKEDESTITNGIQIFLDNYLGELNFATTIDNLIVIDEKDAQQEAAAIGKLSSFLIWRQKEFIEKYEGLRHNTENDHYSGLTAERRDGKPLVAVVNTDLLNWDSKASHPWIMIVEIKFDGESNNGMPDEEDRKLLDEIEEEIIEELKDFEGYLNIGRETVDSSREIYFACKEFRKPSKVLRQIQDTYKSVFDVEYDIYKDKYWQSFNRFNANN